MQKEERHFFYNPWLLHLLHSRVLYTEELLALHDWRTNGGGTAARIEPGEQRRLIVENVRAECIVHDVSHLMECMAKEQFPFDVYYANFEYVLYRLARLFRPQAVQLHPGALDTGAVFLCEVKLLCALSQQEVEAEAEKALIFDAAERYLAKYYVTNVTLYETEAVKRISLLMNAKRVLDHAAARRNRRQDYIVCYTKDLVVSLIYGLLFDEFIAALQLEATLLNYHLAEEKQEKRTRVDAQLHLLERLRPIIEQQQVDEFAFAVEAFPAEVYEADRQAAYRRDRTAEYNRRLNRQYVMQRNPEPSVAQIETSATEIIITECQTGEHRYVRLANHPHHYVHITRRFILDCALKRVHGLDCVMRWPLAEAAATSYDALEQHRLQYARCCNVCRYFRCNEALSQFYALCEEHQYNRAVCLLTGAGSGEDHEAALNRQLTFVLIELVGPLHGALCHCLHNVMRLFRGARFVITSQQYCTVTECGRDEHGGGSGVELFDMLDLPRLMHDMMEGVTDQVMIMETETQLCSLRSSRLARFPEKHHTALAMEIALLLRLIRALTHQQVEVEKYERSLSNRALEIDAGSSTSVHRDVQAQLVTIYTLYCEVLRDWLSLKSRGKYLFT